MKYEIKFVGESSVLEYTVPADCLIQDDSNGHTWTKGKVKCGSCGKERICYVWEQPQDYRDTYSFFCQECMEDEWPDVIGLEEENENSKTD